MAAASLDANFKEELSAIEQWFRVLSEAERTAALYSLLQSSTQVQMRFFVTVLQQMARADPIQALLSPANPGQLSMEAQMEAKLASMGLKSPASPVIRQFARQSLGAQQQQPGSPLAESFLSPNAAAGQAQQQGGNNPPSPVLGQGEGDTAAASALASQRAKLKAGRTSAPANLLGPGNNGRDMEALKSPLWTDKERVVERRSPSPDSRTKGMGDSADWRATARPTGQHAGNNLSQSVGPPSSAQFLRSPALDLDNQLSPLVGGSWASMVNTPLVPMFGGKNGAEPGSTMEQGNFGGITSPDLSAAAARLGSWSGQQSQNSQQGIVLDDVRKFRRSARVSAGPGGYGALSGGALGGMYDADQGKGQQQREREEHQRRAQMHQNAINLGLGSLGASQASHQSRNGLASPGLGAAQQAALSAQQNWRQGLGSPGLTGTGLGVNGAEFGGAGGDMGPNAQLANLFALQQQMMAQQQTMQQLNMAAAAGLALTPVQMMGLQQQQQQQAALLSPGRLGMGMGFGNGMGGLGMGGLGMGLGMPSPRRSPRGDTRSPGGFGGGGGMAGAGAKSHQPSAAGSGTNPDEPLDMSLLADVPAWLRSLRLHKYTTNFEKSSWEEMVQLDEAGLEGAGVSAAGARKKFLQVFATVKSKTGGGAEGAGGASGEGKEVEGLAIHDGASTRSVSPAPPANDW